jgi:hypothetical protein
MLDLMSNSPKLADESPSTYMASPTALPGDSGISILTTLTVLRACVTGKVKITMLAGSAVFDRASARQP